MDKMTVLSALARRLPTLSVPDRERQTDGGIEWLAPRVGNPLVNLFHQGVCFVAG